MCSEGITPSVITRVRKGPGVALVDATVEDQLYLFGPSQIEIFSDYLLEEHPAAHLAVQHLGER